MRLLGGFSLEEGEIRRDELEVSCLDRKQKAFGLFPHRALGVLFVTRRRVVFLADEKPLFETELRRLVAASVSFRSLWTGESLLVLRYHDAAGRAESVRFRHIPAYQEASADTGATVFPAWIESVARLMREEHFELECP